MKEQTYRVYIEEKITREYDVIAESPEDAELMVWGEIPNSNFHVIDDKKELIAVAVAEVLIADMNFCAPCYTKEVKIKITEEELHKKILKYLNKSLEQNLAEKSEGKKNQIKI